MPSSNDRRSRFDNFHVIFSRRFEVKISSVSSRERHSREILLRSGAYGSIFLLDDDRVPDKIQRDECPFRLKYDAFQLASNFRKSLLFFQSLGLVARIV